MEAVAALGLIGNIIDFTKTGLSILHLSYRLYKAVGDAPKELENLNALMQPIQSTTRRLSLHSETSPTAGLDTHILCDYARKSTNLAAKVSSLVTGFGLRPDPSIWHAFKCGCRIHYHSSDIKELQVQVQDLNDRITGYLQCLI